MRWTELLQEIRKMRFEEAYGVRKSIKSGRSSADVGGMRSDISALRRYIDRYEEEGLEEGLLDKRLTQVSSRRAPLDEVLAVVDSYRTRHVGWNVKRFHAWYRRDGWKRSYTWVKNTLQSRGLVSRAAKKGRSLHNSTILVKI